MEQTKILLEHIDYCQECREELEVYYILLIGLKQLDEDTSSSLDLHRKFEEQLHAVQERLNKKQMERTTRTALLLVVIGSLFLLLAGDQQKVTHKDDIEKTNQTVFQRLPKYTAIRNDGRHVWQDIEWNE